MAWQVYKEFIDLDFNHDFSMSFDFSLGTHETLGLGFRERTSIPLIRSLTNFSKNLERNIILSSSPDVFAISKIYQYENGLIVKRRLDNSSFFDKKMKIVNDKIYEEVTDTDNFDRKKYIDYFVDNNILYVYYPEKYALNSTGKIGMIFQDDTMSFVFSASNGDVFDEKYYLDGTFRGDKKKTRMTITNNGKLVNISQKDEFFSTMFYIQFTDGLEHGYIFAGTEAPNDLNSLVTDLCVFGTKIQ